MGDSVPSGQMGSFGKSFLPMANIPKVPVTGWYEADLGGGGVLCCNHLIREGAGIHQVLRWTPGALRLSLGLL